MFGLFSVGTGQQMPFFVLLSWVHTVLLSFPLQHLPSSIHDKYNLIHFQTHQKNGATLIFTNQSIVSVVLIFVPCFLKHAPFSCPFFLFLGPSPCNLAIPREIPSPRGIFQACILLCLCISFRYPLRMSHRGVDALSTFSDALMVSLVCPLSTSMDTTTVVIR